MVKRVAKNTIRYFDSHINLVLDSLSLSTIMLINLVNDNVDKHYQHQVICEAG